MSRILLADHSPHAQRMGERILRDEGFEVATVTDGETALLRLKDLAPDLVLADISLPSRNGYEVCEYVKTSGKYPQTRVILTAGPVTAYDEARARSAGSDGFVRKPFEASVLLGTLQPLVEKPEANAAASQAQSAAKPASPVPTKTSVAVAPVPAAPKPIDREQVRAAVILALEASMITIIENITDKVVVALDTETRPAVTAPAKPASPPKAAPVESKTVTAAAPKSGAPLTSPAPAAEIKPEPAPATPATEPVVRIRTPLFRSIT
jgi:CheY-like chemotaxis protein